MKARDLLVEFYDPADDESMEYSYDDTRRPRLTFHHIHKMRIAKDLERVDKAEHLAFIPQMYNPEPEEGDTTL